MPRKLTVIPHLSSTELKDRYQTSHDPVESRRWHLLWLVSDHYTLTAAAEAVGFNYDYARRIVRTYNAEGATSVRNRRRDKRPDQSRSLLNEHQLEALKERLNSPPDDGGVWSGPKVARVMAHLLGRDHVWPQRGWDYLKLVGYSCQEPRPLHVKGNAEAKAAFKKTCPPVKLS